MAHPRSPDLAALRSGKPLIVLVEDEFLLRVSLAKGIDDAGYSVLSAASGDEGLNLLRGGRADLAIIDLVLPGRLDGLALAHAAKKLQPTLRLIMTSGKAFANERESATTLGPLLAKPFRLDALLGEIQRQLGPATKPTH
jgi:DNA-binding response OmpR family regulator